MNRGKQHTDPDCEFCQILGGERPARVVWEDENVLAFFPLEPAVLGHTLVIPRQHVPDIWSLTIAESRPLTEAVLRIAHGVRDALSPDGLNVINSSGRAASQSVFHLHVHVVPRWRNDRIGDIWPPAEPWSGEIKDEVLEELKAATNRVRAL